MSQLANRILEISPKGINDFPGTYEEYLERLGDDHLDADAVLRMRREQKKKAAAAKGDGNGAPSVDDKQRQKLQKDLTRKRDEVTSAVEKAESRIHAINELFCDPTFFDRTSSGDVKKLENEQKTLSTRVEELMGEWEKLEEQLGALGA